MPELAYKNKVNFDWMLYLLFFNVFLERNESSFPLFYIFNPARVAVHTPYLNTFVKPQTSSNLYGLLFKKRIFQGVLQFQPLKQRLTRWSN